jgi:hypothetical protein
LPRAHGVEWIRQEVCHGADKPLRVRQFDMRVEGRLVDPFRVNEVDHGIPRGFEEMDAHASRLGARGFYDEIQLVAHL